jgi:hypothetical protein
VKCEAHGWHGAEQEHLSSASLLGIKDTAHPWALVVFKADGTYLQLAVASLRQLQSELEFL